MKRSKEALSILLVFLVGVLFALGLGMAGLTQRQKVLAFLNLQIFDWSLAVVMASAVIVSAFLTPLVRRLARPWFEDRWHVPTRKDFDFELFAGATLFGVGWGLLGFCPGPAWIAMVTGDAAPWVFVAAMLAGMKIAHLVEAVWVQRKGPS